MVRTVKEVVVNKRILGTLFKYGLGIAVLVLVVSWHWNPTENPKALPPLGASTVGLLAAPSGQGPWLAATSLVPGRTSSSPGLRAALSRPLQLGPLTLAVAFYGVGVLLTFYRWYVLVRAQELPFTVANALRLGSIGFSLSTFLPGSIGGDLAKAVFLAREQNRRTVAVATVLLDRAMGLWGIFWIEALLGGAYWILGSPIIHQSPYLRFFVLASAVIIGVTVGLWLLLGILPAWRAERFAGRLGRIPKLGHMAAEFWRAVWLYRLKRRSIAGALLLSLASQVCFVLGFFFAAQVLQDPGQIGVVVPSLEAHFLVVPIGVAIQALFPAPGGVGGAEAGYGWLYSQVQMPFASGVLACLTQRLVMWGLALVSYFLFLRLASSMRLDQLKAAAAVDLSTV
jgi:uncharacterized membrane protein YbhN (UPF0104 family)